MTSGLEYFLENTHLGKNVIQNMYFYDKQLVCNRRKKLNLCIQFVT